MKQYMLLFSLGPVQAFIMQARKTRDLWLGSYLLSLLMEASMVSIDKEAFIFPSKQKIEGNIPDLPNKYIAIFDTYEKAQGAAEKSKRDIETLWKGICNDVWAKIVARQAKAGEEDPQRIWDRQTNPNTFFEIFWAIVQGDEAEIAYAPWLRHTQKALAARKQLRHVTLEESGIAFIDKNGKEISLLDEPGEKSTISGEREALHGTETPRLFWDELAKKLTAVHMRHDLGLGGEERLDAIDTVKRFAYRSQTLVEKKLDAGFPSTSSIATATFVERLLKQKLDSTTLEAFGFDARADGSAELRQMLNTALEVWLKATSDPLDEMSIKTIPYLKRAADEEHSNLGILKRDGDCYFPETFTSQRLQKDYNITPSSTAEERAKKGLEALRSLLQATSKLEIAHPTPYYAMVQMDGDRMGKLLDDVESRGEHKEISEALSTFSRKSAIQVVETAYPGRLIYAGGDDVFALAPLARDYRRSKQKEDELLTILDLVDRLQQEYCTIVRDKVVGEKRKQEVTASIGIAIAHHFTSLSYVRRVSKEAESLAKKHYGRNALVVTVIRRSGEQTRVGCRWEYELSQDEKTQIIKPFSLFSAFYEFFKTDALSDKCIHTLLEEASTLVALNREAQVSEVRRVLQRQRRDEHDLPNKAIIDIAQKLVDLAAAMDADKKPSLEENQKKSVELHSTGRRYGLVEVLGWLLVMVFLARKEQE